MNTTQILQNLQRYGIQYQSHTGEDISSHLLGTHAILTRWGASPDLCLSGLCHSVYGSECYTAQTVPLSTRTFLQDTIGTKAENLVYLFGALQKNSLWTNLGREPHTHMIQDRFKKDTVKISLEELKDLITLTLANWLELKSTQEKKPNGQEELLRAKDFLPQIAYQELVQACGH